MTRRTVRHPGTRRHVRGDDGAATVEYAGLIIVVVAIILSVVMAASPVGATIAARLCEAVGGSCGSTTPVAADDQPTKACVVSTNTVNAKANVTIAFIDIGGERSVKVERFSDDTVRVTVAGEAAVQAVLSSPEAYGKLRVLDHGGMVGAGGSAGGGLLAGGGLEYTFPDDAAAGEFTDWLTRQAVKEGLTVAGSAGSPMTGPLVGPAVEAGDWLLRKITGYDYTPPAPGAWYVEGGKVVSAGGSIGDLVSGAAGSFRAEDVLGMKVAEDGSKTVYTRVEMTADGLAQLGLSPENPVVGAGGSFNLGAQVVIGTTIDASGKLVSVALDGAATAEGSTTLSTLFGAPPLDGGKGVQLSSEFPVTDANRARVEASIAAIAGGALMTGPGTAGAAAAPFVFQEAARNGQVTAQFADVDTSGLVDAALGVKAPAVGGLGFGLGAGTSESTTTGGKYLTDTGWKEWAACAQS